MNIFLTYYLITYTFSYISNDQELQIQFVKVLDNLCASGSDLEGLTRYIRDTVGLLTVNVYKSQYNFIKIARLYKYHTHGHTLGLCDNGKSYISITPDNIHYIISINDIISIMYHLP